MAGSALPKRIYKYRGFSNRVLDMLVRDELYYSDPSDFNDPLDTRPFLEADLPAGQLEQILTRLVEERTRAEMTKAAKSIRYSGPRTIDHIAQLSQARTVALIEELRYQATAPYYEGVADPLSYLLGRRLETELRGRYDRGIVSFGSRATCPLMWSHYGDQHNGICAGYSVPEGAAGSLFRVAYGGSRKVKASDVAAMDAEPEARRRVDEAVLLRKAPSWRYEREWRLIGNHGSQDSPLELEDVTFGLRCSSTIKYTIVKALENRGRDVRFYEIADGGTTFRLYKRPLEVGELLAGLPRRHLGVLDAFSDLDLLDQSGAEHTEQPPAS